MLANKTEKAIKRVGKAIGVLVDVTEYCDSAVGVHQVVNTHSSQCSNTWRRYCSSSWILTSGDMKITWYSPMIALISALGGK